MSIPFVVRRLLPVWAAILLAGCGSSATPAMIASFPKQNPPPIASFPQPEPPLIAQHRSLIVSTENVDWAASQAEEIALAWGGYVQSSQSWYAGDGKHTLVEIVVPDSASDSVYARLLQLGRPISGDGNSLEPCIYPARSGWGCMAQIAVEFQPAFTGGHPVITQPSVFLAGLFFAGIVLFSLALVVGALILFFTAVKKAAGWINKL
jgi:hypothetical protein